MEQKRNNGVNANFKKQILPKTSIKLPTPKMKIPMGEKPPVPKRTQRYIFTLDVKFSVIAPPDVDRKTLTERIETLVADYLKENYDVAYVSIPGRPGLPDAATITELKHKSFEKGIK